MTLLGFLSLKNEVNVPSKSNKQKKIVLKISLCWHVEGQWRKWQDPDPNRDPLVRSMDPRIRIRIHLKMSWIRNTALLILRIQKNYAQVHHLQSKNFSSKIFVTMLFCRHYFSPLNTFLSKGKDPDPGPHLWLMDPDPGGPKTCGSGSPNTGF